MIFDYPRNVRFQCLRCALCCGDTTERVRRILLLEAETRRIAQAIRKPIEEFAMRIEGHAPYVYEMIKTVEEGKCVFLEKKECTVYPMRPLICRFYPFELKIVGNAKREFFFTKECLGIGKGERLTKSYFKSLLQQIKKASM